MKINQRLFFPVVLLGLVLILAGCDWNLKFLKKEEKSVKKNKTETQTQTQTQADKQEQTIPVTVIVAVLKTNLGEIKIKLFEKEAPRTVVNFVNLANQDFYDGVKFHRVIKDFMIQTGDPNSRDNDWADDGTGGPGYTFEDEINPKNSGLTDEQIKELEAQGYNYNYNLTSSGLVRTAVAMANSGPNTNGSQFFIVTASSTPWLNGKHTVFGEVVEGLAVVDQIEASEVNENSHPLKDIIVEDVTILVNEAAQEALGLTPEPDSDGATSTEAASTDKNLEETTSTDSTPAPQSPSPSATTTE